MKRIDGRAKSVRELLQDARYTIDFYQREYAWEERQVRELIDDLTGKFLDFYEPEHARHEVENYGHYFLGPIVISHKRNQRFIVDGQQRLTTLTLLLIYLHHLQAGLEDRVDLRGLIFSEKYGRKSFNLDVADRVDCMERLFAGDEFNAGDSTASVRNIVARYENIADHFPDEISGSALPYFADWLEDNVHFVEIEAYSDEDAYTIFETMNDRGLSLSLPEMLKGYVLANITHEQDQRKVNSLWKARMHELREIGPEEDTDFFKNWLRARHADTIRPGKKGAENRDYERIGTEFHRWVRDQKQLLGLVGSDDFMRFVERDVDFYARQVMKIRGASMAITPGLESVYYNEDRGFTLQTQVLLSALSPNDSPATISRKIALASDYLDIWLGRRVWNFRTNTYSSVKYTMFILSKELREKTVEELSVLLLRMLDEERETFAREPNFHLHARNHRQMKHVLARLTHWLDDRCGETTQFDDLVSRETKRPFEIEHIWPNRHERFLRWFPSAADFQAARNRIGGLILLQRGPNQSLGDKTYEEKRNAYVSQGQNLLTRSLHPMAYENNPAFRRLIDETGLPFRPYETFGPAAQKERQELYLRIAEWVWNPSRLGLDGLKPPVPEALDEDDDNDSGSASSVDRVYWEERAPQSLPSAEKILSIASVDGQHYHPNYVKNYIGLRGNRGVTNFVIIRPRRDFVRIGAVLPDRSEWIAKLRSNGLDSKDSRGRVWFNVGCNEIDERFSLLEEVVHAAREESEG